MTLNATPRVTPVYPPFNREEIFAPKTDETLLETSKLLADSSVISYLVSPRDALYRQHVLGHVAPLEQRFQALNDTVSTPNWADVWTKYVRVDFGREVRKKMQTTNAKRPTLEVISKWNSVVWFSSVSSL